MVADLRSCLRMPKGDQVSEIVDAAEYKQYVSQREIDHRNGKQHPKIPHRQPHHSRFVTQNAAQHPAVKAEKTNGKIGRERISQKRVDKLPAKQRNHGTRAAAAGTVQMHKIVKRTVGVNISEGKRVDQRAIKKGADDQSREYQLYTCENKQAPGAP